MSEAERLRLLAHELRSPVAALAGFAEVAPTASVDARKRMLVLASAAARDIERLLLDTEPTSLRRERIDLAALAAGLHRSDGAVRVTGDASGVVDGDPTRLRQVLANLVANGLRHGTEATIVVEDGDEVVVEVADNGPGVQDGLDPFARGSSGAGSTGYGLWLARAIVEAHGGSLDLVSSSGEGARFRLALPRASGAR